MPFRLLLALGRWRNRRLKSRAARQAGGLMRPSWLSGKSVYQLAKLARRKPRLAELATREVNRRLIVGRMLRA